MSIGEEYSFKTSGHERSGSVVILRAENGRSYAYAYVSRPALYPLVQ